MITLEEVLKKTTHNFDKRSEHALNDVLRGAREQGIPCINCGKLIDKSNLSSKCDNS